MNHHGPIQPELDPKTFVSDATTTSQMANKLGVSNLQLKRRESDKWCTYTCIQNKRMKLRMNRRLKEDTSRLDRCV